MGNICLYHGRRDCSADRDSIEDHGRPRVGANRRRKCPSLGESIYTRMRKEVE